MGHYANREQYGRSRRGEYSGSRYGYGDANPYRVLRTISKDNLTIRPMNVQAIGVRLGMAIANPTNAD